MGSNSAARRAGYKPKIKPQATENPTASTTEYNGTTNFQANPKTPAATEMS